MLSSTLEQQSLEANSSGHMITLTGCAGVAIPRCLLVPVGGDDLWNGQFRILCSYAQLSKSSQADLNGHVALPKDSHKYQTRRLHVFTDSHVIPFNDLDADDKSDRAWLKNQAVLGALVYMTVHTSARSHAKRGCKHIMSHLESNLLQSSTGFTTKSVGWLLDEENATMETIDDGATATAEIDLCYQARQLVIDQESSPILTPVASDCDARQVDPGPSANTLGVSPLFVDSCGRLSAVSALSSEYYKKQLSSIRTIETPK